MLRVTLQFYPTNFECSFPFTLKSRLESLWDYHKLFGCTEQCYTANGQDPLRERGSKRNQTLVDDRGVFEHSLSHLQLPKHDILSVARKHKLFNSKPLQCVIN